MLKTVIYFGAGLAALGEVWTPTETPADACEGVTSACGTCLVPTDGGTWAGSACILSAPCAALVGKPAAGTGCGDTGFKKVEDGAKNVHYMFVQEASNSDDIVGGEYRYYSSAAPTLTGTINSSHAELFQVDAQCETAPTACPEVTSGDSDPLPVVATDAALCGATVEVYTFTETTDTSDVVHATGIVAWTMTALSTPDHVLALYDAGSPCPVSATVRLGLVMWEPYTGSGGAGAVQCQTGPAFDSSWTPHSEAAEAALIAACDAQGTCTCGAGVPAQPPCPAAFAPAPASKTGDWPKMGDCGTIGGVEVVFVATLDNSDEGDFQIHGRGEADDCPTDGALAGLDDCEAYIPGDGEEDELCVDNAGAKNWTPLKGSSVTTEEWLALIEEACTGHGVCTCGGVGDIPCPAAKAVFVDVLPITPSDFECGTIDGVQVVFVATHETADVDYEMYWPDLETCPLGDGVFLPADCEDFFTTEPTDPEVICGLEPNVITLKCTLPPEVTTGSECTVEAPCEAYVSTSLFGAVWPEECECGVITSGDDTLYVVYVGTTEDAGIYVPEVLSCPDAVVGASGACDGPVGPTEGPEDGGASSAVLALAATIAYLL